VPSERNDHQRAAAPLASAIGRRWRRTHVNFLSFLARVVCEEEDWCAEWFITRSS
jgi:hypothetical protein